MVGCVSVHREAGEWLGGRDQLLHASWLTIDSAINRPKKKQKRKP